MPAKPRRGETRGTKPSDFKVSLDLTKEKNYCPALCVEASSFEEFFSASVLRVRGDPTVDFPNAANSGPRCAS